MLIDDVVLKAIRVRARQFFHLAARRVRAARASERPIASGLPLGSA